MGRDAEPWYGYRGYGGYRKRSAEADVDGEDLGDYLSYEKRDAEPGYYGLGLSRGGYRGYYRGKRSAEADVDGGDLGDYLSYEKRDAEPGYYGLGLSRGG